jgi:hypothetical protein
MKEIGLKELKNSLKHTHLKLNLAFLEELLKSASKSDFPHKNKDFCKKIKCPINKTKKISLTIYGWKKGYRTVPFSKLIKIIRLSDYSWKDIEKNLLSIKAGIRAGEIHPKFPIKIDEKSGSIIGHILGDGSIDKRFHAIFYSNSNIQLLKEFRKNMKNIFRIEPRIWVQERRKFEEKTKWLKRIDNLNKVPNKHNVGLFYPKICSDILYSIYGKFAEGKNKEITNKIKKSNEAFKKGLIRAFFDDECSISSKNYSIRVYQDKKNILEDLREILKEFNIKPQIIRFYNKNNKLRYYFNITGFKEYYKFSKKIGFTSPKKEEELKLLINNVQNSKYFKKKYSM